jgi:hypothetical protein
MLALPGAAGAHDEIAVVGALFAAVYGVSSALFIPWERLPFWPLHAASVLSLPLAVLMAWATGGHDSPARFLVAFVVVWAACFCRPRVIAVYVVVSSLAFAGVHLLEDDAGAFLREMTIVLPGLAAIAATVAIGRQALDALLGATATSAREHRALLAVATAVADGRRRDDLHAIVAEEAAGVLGADASAILRYDGDSTEVMGSWSRDMPRYPAGTVLPVEPDSEIAQVFRTGLPVLVRREDDLRSQRVSELGYRSLAAARSASETGSGGSSRSARPPRRGCRQAPSCGSRTSARS